MNDGTYIKADFEQLPGYDFCTARKKGVVPDKLKMKKIVKFTKQYIV